jgi:putative transposase
MNSFTRYYNIKYKRKGPLFLPRFQARRILTDEDLVHNSRYQHLNPYSGGLVSSLEDLANYPWSSYPCYISAKKSPIVDVNQILEHFNQDKVKYRQFVEDQADYQKSLESLKYMNKW